MATDSSKGGDYQQQIVRLWAASLVVAIIFFVFYAVRTLYSYEEAEIRRESYLANLDQLYQQELQECLGLGAQIPEEEGAPAAAESEPECIARINDEGRYAQLVRKWGGADAVRTTLR